MPPPRATYSIKDVMALFGLSRSAVYLALKTGEIPSFRIGKRVLIPKEAIDKMLAGPFKRPSPNA